MRQLTASAVGLIILIGLAAAFAVAGERNRSEMPAFELNGIDSTVLEELN